ncbi:hypothetical protein QVD17_32243 [Tagetes erecta]|uniref:HTH La-type RNA-binding domain-containing protein n=1 Tax=Tagetes erecta TaxID=13708 RepID=A0AAD8K599_TARER|nr:hypothetical protein QVD17_32243 [Tagetes erecta]
MTADSSISTVTPNLPSPWSQVVRAGIEPVDADPATAVDVIPPPESFSGDSSDCNAGGEVKSAWSKPSANGVDEGEISPVMGAVLWPALSESTRSGVKSLSESNRSGDGSAAVTQASVSSQPQQKHVKHAASSNTNSNNVRHHHRHNRRGGGAGGASAGQNRPQPPAPPTPLPPPQVPSLPPPFPYVDMYGNLVPIVSEPMQPRFKGNNWSPRPVDHSLNRHPARRNNFSPRGVNNGHHGPRSPAGKDGHIPHQMGPSAPPPFRGFVRPPLFFPQPLRPYAVPMGFEMGAPYMYFPTLAQVPYGARPVASHGASASSLHDDIRKQIEYYFSDDNLAKDNYLRSHMDEEGWVPIKLIADFRRVQAMTNDIQVLLNSLRDSSTVEAQGDRVRRHGDWKRWTHTRHEATENSVEEASLQKLTLEDGPTNDKQVLANGDVSSEDPCNGCLRKKGELWMDWLMSLDYLYSLSYYMLVIDDWWTVGSDVFGALGVLLLVTTEDDED